MTLTYTLSKMVPRPQKLIQYVRQLPYHDLWNTVNGILRAVFEGNFPSTNPGGLIFGGAYTWSGLFSEFYGTLDHGILLSNISKRFGMNGSVLKWFHSYLSHRTQFVKVNGASWDHHNSESWWSSRMGSRTVIISHLYVSIGWHCLVSWSEF